MKNCKSCCFLLPLQKYASKVKCISPSAQHAYPLLKSTSFQRLSTLFHAYANSINLNLPQRMCSPDIIKTFLVMHIDYKYLRRLLPPLSSLTSQTSFPSMLTAKFILCQDNCYPNSFSLPPHRHTHTTHSIKSLAQEKQFCLPYLSYEESAERQSRWQSTRKLLSELPPISSQIKSLISLRIIFLSYYSFSNTEEHHFLYHKNLILKTRLKNLLPIYIATSYSKALSYSLYLSFPIITRL